MEARIDNYNGWISGAEAKVLRIQLEKIISDSGFTILNFMEHHYQPFGYTAVWLLAESHCALHTFPEEDKTYVELSSCNREMYAAFLSRFKEAFVILD